MTKPFHMLLACAIGFLCLSCEEKEEKRVSPLGITESKDTEGTGYDLPEIQESGELIAATRSGPDT